MQIHNLLNDGATVVLSATPRQLEDFALYIIDKVKADEAKAKQTTQEEDEVLTMHEAKDFLKISLPTLSRWTNRGILHPKKIGKKIYYSKAELRAITKR